MAPRRQPTRGGAKAAPAKDASRAKETAGAGGTEASGAAANVGGAATARATTPSQPMPGRVPLWGFSDLRALKFFS